jgi:energy-converting hydrogenase A subunit M
MFERAYVSKTMAEKMSDDLIKKINKLLPASTPYPETIYKEISQTLNINEYQIRRYIKAMTFLEKIEPK